MSVPISAQRRAKQATQDPFLKLWQLYPLFFVAVFLSHWTLLRLPYFWDEAGYYIPAAWDLFRTGTLIPQSTITNAHPPLPSILLAGWWHLSGFVISGTRTFICMISAAALLAVYTLARNLAGAVAGFTTAILTGMYSIWYAQSTLAHADIFAAAFTLWALVFYLAPQFSPADLLKEDAPSRDLFRDRLWTATLFSFSVLSKETAIVTPAALTVWEIYLAYASWRSQPERRSHLIWAATLAAPVLPLIAWYGYHYHRTGFVFGNPEFLRYNATANLSVHRILLCLYHRLLHLTAHMNMFVPVLCGVAALLIPVASPRAPKPLPRRVLRAIAVILIANWIAFSVLGGALLTRYLLPMYPLILLVCVSLWRRHIRRWYLVAALSGAGFLSAIWINPPYAFAPEDNLTYRDMIVLHQQAVRIIDRRFPASTVLTAWPATSELSRPEIGYTTTPIRVYPVVNFSFSNLQQAAADPGGFDTALLFSTKWEPPPGSLDMSRKNRPSDAKFFDFHHDLTPTQAAAMLHGEIVWQGRRGNEWAAVLHFPRIVTASVEPDATR